MRKLPKVLRGLLRPLWIYLGCGLAGALILSSPAYANSWPPMAIFLLHLPILPSLATYGLGLVAIVVMEALILHRREKVKLFKSLGCTALANLDSLIMGCLITFSFVCLPSVLRQIALGRIFDKSSVLLFLGSLLPPYIMLVVGSNAISASDNSIRNWMTTIYNLILWGFVWLVGLVLTVLLFDWVRTINYGLANFEFFPDPKVPFYVNLLQLLGAILFLILGFTMSWVTEAFVLSKIFKNRTKHFLQTVLIMNVRSYSYIAIPITLFFLSPMLRRLLNFQF
jgi:hypothetical protein